MDTVTTKVIGNQKVEVWYDIDGMNPRDWDNLGTMVCFHRKYRLGDKHDYRDKDHFIQNLLEEDTIEKITEEMQSDKVHRTNWERELDDRLLEIVSQKYLVKPLYLYDHSGITISTGSFSCPWDSGQVGWVYVSHEDIIKEYGTLDIEKASELLDGEVETYDNYIQGDVYGFTLSKSEGCPHCGNVEWEVVHSCGGYLGDISKSGILEEIPKEFHEFL